MFRFFHEERDHGGKKYQEGGQLCYRHITTEYETPLISPKTFYEKAGRAVKNQEPKEEPTFELFLCMKPEENGENNESAQGSVQLGRVEWHVQGGQGVGMDKNHPPFHLRGLAVTATGHKTSEATNPLPDSRRRGPEISNFPKREVMALQIPAQDQQNSNKTA